MIAQAQCPTRLIQSILVKLTSSHDQNCSKTPDPSLVCGTNHTMAGCFLAREPWSSDSKGRAQHVCTRPETIRGSLIKRTPRNPLYRSHDAATRAFLAFGLDPEYQLRARSLQNESSCRACQSAFGKAGRRAQGGAVCFSGPVLCTNLLKK